MIQEAMNWDIRSRTPRTRPLQALHPPVWLGDLKDADAVVASVRVDAITVWAQSTKGGELEAQGVEVECNGPFGLIQDKGSSRPSSLEIATPFD